MSLSDEIIEVRLSSLEKVLGLLGNIRVARADVGEVEVLDDPLHDVMRSGLKVGLRLPGLYYVCRSIRLNEAWAVRRGVPALSFSVHNRTGLKRVTASTPHAHQFAGQLAARRHVGV